MKQLVAMCNCLTTEDRCRPASEFMGENGLLVLLLTTDRTQRKDQRELSLYGKDSSVSLV